MSQLVNPSIRILGLSPYPKWLQFGPGLFQYGIKTIYLSLTLIMRLSQIKSVPKFVMVQVK